MGRASRNILASQARIQVPWIKVVIGNYTFGVYSQKGLDKNDEGNFLTRQVQYPNYIQSLSVVKINGKVNQYTLQITYPVRSTDDPNFFEKVFSSVSTTRRIIFSYGDATMPTYVYKDEEALITKISQTFNIAGATINYTIEATSIATLASSGAYTFLGGRLKPSDRIKEVFKNTTYGMQNIFTGMDVNNLEAWIEGGDAEVEVETKINTSPLDYINYLTSCMIPEGTTTTSVPSDIYILTLHDDTVYDDHFKIDLERPGPYFRVKKTSHLIQQADAYEIDVGFNTSTIVRSFSIEDKENFSILYNYNAELHPEQYVQRLTRDGTWETAYAPMMASANTVHNARADDKTWLTKITKYPISATIQVQGLLRPAQLMQYIRLNVYFPGSSSNGGNIHASSGLYLITKQIDEIGSNGYYTTLNMTRISS